MTFDPVVLLIDDMQKARELHSELLRLNGFTTIAVASRAEAEQELRAGPGVDIVVTDVNLDESEIGDISGIHLASKIREIRPEIPIIGYSGRFEENELPRQYLQLFESVHLRGAE